MGAEDLQDCINQAELLVIPDKGFSLLGQTSGRE